MTYASDALGTREMFSSLSYSVNQCMENDLDFEFTDEQRDKQKR